MTDCSGNGLCFKECFCICYDEVTDVDYDVCICGHRAHNVKYCRAEACKYDCKFQICKNFEICNMVMPAWCYDRFPGDGACFDCWAYYGPMTKSDKDEECAICLEDKIVVGLSCHPSHKICFGCWDKTITSQPYPSQCPLCRTAIGGWKLNVG